MIVIWREWLLWASNFWESLKESIRNIVMSFIVLNLVVLVKYCGCITQQNDRFIKVSLAEFILGLVIDINLSIFRNGIPPRVFL